MRQARGLGNVGELDVVTLGISILMIERDHQVAAFLVSQNRGAVDGDDVELAVVVAVDQPHAAAHRLDDVLFIGRRNVRDSKTCFLRDVFELWEGCRWAGRLRLL